MPLAQKIIETSLFRVRHFSEIAETGSLAWTLEYQADERKEIRNRYN